MESFHCECCRIEVNNISTMKAHLAGKRHQRLKAIFEQRKNESMRSIYVSSLPIAHNIEQILRDHFMKFGSLENVVVLRGFAFVKFVDPNSADEALSSHHRIEGKKLIVRRKRLEHPLQKKNQEENKEVVASDKIKNTLLLEKMKDYRTVEQQMIILQTELCLRKESLYIRAEIRNVFNDILRRYFPGSELHLFGSSANGFGFEGCDVDLHLQLPSGWCNLEDDTLINEVPSINDVEASNVRIEQLSSSAKLQLIKKFIKKYITDARQVIFIPSQRCPLLKFKYKYCTDYLSCDLTIGKGISVRNTKLLAIYRQLDSRVLLLVTTLRWWAKCQELINSDCKLTSYAFIFLVIFFLQNLDPPLVPTVEELAQLAETKCVIDDWDCSFCENLNSIPKPTNNQTVEELLKQFFKFYASFDFATTVVCPRFGHGICHDILASRSSFEGFKIGPVCIQDPFILNHNIAGNFNIKYFQDFVKKLSFCAELLSKGDQHSDNNGIAALMREIPVETNADGSLSFFVTSKYKTIKNDASQVSTSSEHQIMTDWFKTVCSVVKHVLEKALLSECEIIVDKLQENELQLTRKRSLSFSNDDEQQQKHFMGDLALKDRRAANCPTVSTFATANVADGCVQTGSILNVTNSCSENCQTMSDEECFFDVEMKNSDNSEVQGKLPSLQQSDYPCADKINDGILLHMRCKVHENIWHQRKKMSKKHKSEKCDFLDIEHDISQAIIKQHGNNKHFLFDCDLQKYISGGIANIKCELKPVSKNSYEKLKQCIFPFVSKLVNKCMTNLR